MRILSSLLVAFAFGTSAGASLGADTCTPVRPSGLSADAVDQIVLRKVAEALQVPTERIDAHKTIKQLDPSDNVAVTYAFVVVGIGEALAFDSAAAFHEASKASGKRDPWEGVTVATMQVLARKAYFNGTDAPPPPAPRGATYKTRRFSVAVPSQPPNWSLIICNHDQFAFAARDPMLDGVYTAVARDIGLEPFKNEETFLSQVRAAVAQMAPAGRAVTSIDVGIVERTGPPCALASAEITPAVAPELATGGLRYTIYARFCYDSEYPHLGYSALFSHQGRAPASDVRATAMSYIDGVRAAR